MNSGSRLGYRPGGTAAQWCIVVLLTVIATTLVIALCQTGPQALAQSSLPNAAAPAQGVFAVAGQISPNAYGLYLVDPQSASIMVYEYDAAGRRLGLRAARTYLYDRQLEAYGTEPLPSEVADKVRQARRISESTTQPQ